MVLLIIDNFRNVFELVVLLGEVKFFKSVEILICLCSCE